MTESTRRDANRPDAGKVEPPTNAFCQRCGYSSGHVRGCPGERQGGQMGAQRYTDPLALERMEAGGCPECGAPVEAHNGGGGPRCTLTDNGVAARLDQYRKDQVTR